MEKRLYQEECIEAIPDTGAHLIVLATGLGKSYVASRVERKGRLLLISHRNELVEQPRAYYGDDFGIEQGKQVSNGESVVSASIQTLSRRYSRFQRDAFDFIVIDEAHHSVAESYKKVIDYFNPRLLLGMTATPNRGDHVRLDTVYEDVVFERDLKWGIKNGYLADIDYIRANIGLDISRVRVRKGDFYVNELDSFMNTQPLNRAIYDVYQQNAKGKTLIFAVSVSHAEEIARLIPHAAAISGKSKNRKQIIEDFLAGKYRCLVNCSVFTEGVDIPDIETVLIARPTRSIPLYQQMVGRGLRKSATKEKLTLIDVIGNNYDPEICTAASLIGIDTTGVPADRQMEIQGNIFKLQEIVEKITDTPFRWMNNAAQMRQWAEEQKYDTHGVNYYKMPDGSLVCFLIDKHIRIPAQDEVGQVLYNGKRVPMQILLNAVYRKLKENYQDEQAIWNMDIIQKWGVKKASAKQIAMIKSKYPDFPVDKLTRAQASQIINRIVYAQKFGKADNTGTK